AIFIALMFMFVRFVHHNIPDKKDIPWLKNIVEVLKGNEHKVACRRTDPPGATMLTLDTLNTMLAVSEEGMVEEMILALLASPQL
ncbi:hypothetical protein MJM99_32255, partial [Salmonella enterica subsp. enterica serovar Kentucky]|nr:hypothetical protein [Salmonella enterica subsp. enterica serovar Kentucky]